MDAMTMTQLGQSGAFLPVALTTIGSSLGTGIAGAAAVGAWKRCYVQGKPAPFQLAIFAGTPLSQMIYSFILMIIISGKTVDSNGAIMLFSLIVGACAGIGLAVSAWYMGKVAASCCDAFAETVKGFTNNLLVLGIIETVSLFIMVFALVLISMIKTGATVAAGH